MQNYHIDHKKIEGKHAIEGLARPMLATVSLTAGKADGRLARHII